MQQRNVQDLTHVPIADHMCSRTSMGSSCICGGWAHMLLLHCAGYGRCQLPGWPVDPHIIMDTVPVDYVVNASLAAAWAVATNKGQGKPDPHNMLHVYQASVLHLLCFEVLLLRVGAATGCAT